jgi:hypothetical protein
MLVIRSNAMDIWWLFFSCRDFISTMMTTIIILFQSNDKKSTREHQDVLLSLLYSTHTTHNRISQQQHIKMVRLDRSLNSMIKILVILCLAAHLIVLQTTTQKVIYHTNSDRMSSQDAPLLNLPSRIVDSFGPDIMLLLNQSLRRDEVTRTFPDGSSNSSLRSATPHMDATEGNSLYTGTLDISEQMDHRMKQPINALDLMTQYSKIPLADLVNSDPNPTCKQGRAQKSLFRSVTDLEPTITHPAGRKIPKIVHVTSKTRCLPPILQENLERWKFPGHNFYLHDDAAVERLLFETYWPEFPHLNLLRPCMISGAAMADLWRY